MAGVQIGGGVLLKFNRRMKLQSSLAAVLLMYWVVSLLAPSVLPLPLSAVEQSVLAREQWDINRPDPPPTTPIMTRSTGGATFNDQWYAGGQTAMTGGQVPGLIPNAMGATRFFGARANDGEQFSGSTYGLVPSSNGFKNGQSPGFTSGDAGAGQVSGFTSGGGGAGQIPGLTTAGANAGQVPGLPPDAINLPGSFSTNGTLTAASQPGFGGDQAVPGLVPPLMLPDKPVRGTIPEFWKQFLGKRINTGTVLSGVLESDISSSKSERGDTFAVILLDGYTNEGEELIPPNSRILGLIVQSMPAKIQRPGMPGQVKISLNMLVFPDGRNIPIHAFIEHNPAHDQEKEPKVKMAGMGFSDYGQQVKGMMYSFVSGIGFVHARAMRGKEFILKAGTPVAVKLNQPLDLAKMSSTSLTGLVNGQPAAPTGPSPNSGQPGAPQFTPFKMTPNNTRIPGLTIPISSRSEPAPPNLPEFPGPDRTGKVPEGLNAPPALSLDSKSSSDSDPNSVFFKPISTPTSVPDPF